VELSFQFTRSARLFLLKVGVEELTPLKPDEVLVRVEAAGLKAKITPLLFLQ
jgi:hypothetical protein